MPPTPEQRARPWWTPRGTQILGFGTVLVVLGLLTQENAWLTSRVAGYHTCTCPSLEAQLDAAYTAGIAQATSHCKLDPAAVRCREQFFTAVRSDVLSTAASSRGGGGGGGDSPAAHHGRHSVGLSAVSGSRDGVAMMEKHMPGPLAATEPLKELDMASVQKKLEHASTSSQLQCVGVVLAGKHAGKSCSTAWVLGSADGDEVWCRRIEGCKLRCEGPAPCPSPGTLARHTYRAPYPPGSECPDAIRCHRVPMPAVNFDSGGEPLRQGEKDLARLSAAEAIKKKLELAFATEVAEQLTRNGQKWTEMTAEQQQQQQLELVAVAAVAAPSTTASAVESDIAAPAVAAVNLTLSRPATPSAVSLAAAPAAREEASGATEAALQRQELNLLKLKELRQRAKDAGMTAEELDDAMDLDDPREALVAFILQDIKTSSSKTTEARAADEVLLTELQGLALRDLRKRAKAAGVQLDDLENAMDAEEPEEAVIELMRRRSEPAPAVNEEPGPIRVSASKAPPPRCYCFDLCEHTSANAFWASTRGVQITNASSPWLPYFEAVYGGPVPLPIPLYDIDLFYHQSSTWRRQFPRVANPFKPCALESLVSEREHFLSLHFCPFCQRLMPLFAVLQSRCRKSQCAKWYGNPNNARIINPKSSRTQTSTAGNVSCTGIVENGKHKGKNCGAAWYGNEKYCATVGGCVLHNGAVAKTAVKDTVRVTKQMGEVTADTFAAMPFSRLASEAVRLRKKREGPRLLRGECIYRDSASLLKLLFGRFICSIDSHRGAIGRNETLKISVMLYSEI